MAQQSYLDSPMYRQMMAQVLHGSQRGPQYPGEAVANALATALQAYGVKKYGQQQEAREGAKTRALSDALAPDPASVNVTSQITAPGQFQERADAGAYNQPSLQRPDSSEMMARLLKGGNADALAEFTPMYAQNQMQQETQANQPITPYQRANMAEQRRQSDLQQLDAADDRLLGAQDKSADREFQRAQLKRQMGTDDPAYKAEVAGAVAEAEAPSKIKVAAAGRQPAQPRISPGYRMSSDGNLEAIPGGPGDLRQSGQGFQQENAIRDEYRTLSKDYSAVQEAYGRIMSVPESPAGDLSRLYSYVKMLDPGSVVRESEFAVASTARPLLERLGLSWDAVGSLWRGERMTPSMRADFTKSATDIYNQADQQQSSRDVQFRGLAQQYQLDPDRVVNGVRTKPPGPATGGSPKRISGDADYNALASGEAYTDPEGNQRTKR